jgi:AbiV family abortive infection protein
MADLKLSTRKLNALQHACLQNALRLHFDSVLLAKGRSFASAFAVSVIASEELGKAFGIAEIIFQAGFDKGRLHGEDTKFVRALLSDHKLKQGWFVSSLFGIFGPKDVLRRYQTIQSAKNNAIYAGVRKGNHQIVRPFLISASKAGPGGKRREIKAFGSAASLDASVISLCASVFDWAQYRRTKGAVKLHLLLDHDGYLPSFAVVTEGKTSEIKVARTLRFAPGTILAIDRGYHDYEWFRELTQEGVYFATRMKEKAVYEIKEELQVPQNSNVVRDQIICFPRLAREGEEPVLFRRVEIWDADKQEAIVFLSNLLAFGATTIAAIYKDRWQVELFFKALKQNLRVKTFVGTSENALQTQIWTALVAMLLIKYLQLRSTFGWSLSNLVALLRQQLFVHRNLWQWIDSPFQPPPLLDPVVEQLPLGLEL